AARGWGGGRLAGSCQCQNAAGPGPDLAPPPRGAREPWGGGGGSGSEHDREGELGIPLIAVLPDVPLAVEEPLVHDAAADVAVVTHEQVHAATTSVGVEVVEGARDEIVTIERPEVRVDLRHLIEDVGEARGHGPDERIAQEPRGAPQGRLQPVDRE